MSVHLDSTQKLTCFDNNDAECDVRGDDVELVKKSANPEDSNNREVCKNAQLQLWCVVREFEEDIIAIHAKHSDQKQPIK